MWRRGPDRRASRSCSAPRAEGCGRWSRRSCDVLVSIPSPARSSRSTSASPRRALLYEARRQRGAAADGRPDALPVRRLQPAARGPVRGTARQLVDRSRASSRRAARAASSSSTASATTTSSARSRSASRRTPTRCSSASPPEHRARERVLLVSSDATRARHGRATRSANLSSQTFLRDLPPVRASRAPPGGLADRLDETTRARLERLRPRRVGHCKRVQCNKGLSFLRAVARFISTSG